MMIKYVKKIIFKVIDDSTRKLKHFENGCKLSVWKIQLKSQPSLKIFYIFKDNVFLQMQFSLC